MQNKASDKNDESHRHDVASAFLSLTELVARLRGPGGCPWDAQQTNETIKIYILEEAYEVLDAIERGSPQDLCHEVGDLLFQILFLTSMAEEKKDFTLLQVIKEITKKMINRHPHVFGSAKVNSAKEVAANWEKIKKQEKGVADSSPRLLMEVPSGLPALLRAHRLSERASRLESGDKDGEAILRKVDEAWECLKSSLGDKDAQRIGEDIGTFLFNTANLARHWGLNAESLLRKANQEFLDSFHEEERGSHP